MSIFAELGIDNYGIGGSDKPSEEDKDLKKNKKNNHVPLIEKYRPKTVDEIMVDDDISKKIKKIIQDKNMPNIIIAGPPGIGKTTTVLCIAFALYGKNFKNAVIEINASDDRGVKVSDKIANFCKKKINFDDDNFCKHKLIILDEADNMTAKAQNCVSKTIVDYSDTCRFAFTCNESTGIIGAIQSKCIIFSFTSVSPPKISERLKFICKNEKMTYSDDAIDEIAIMSNGDMRSAINNLQLTFNSFNNITIEGVYTVNNKPLPGILKKLIHLCKSGDIDEIFKIINQLKSEGYSHSDIIIGLANAVKYSTDKYIDHEDKILMLDKINNSLFIITKGLTTDLQLYGCVSSIINLYSK